MKNQYEIKTNLSEVLKIYRGQDQRDNLNRHIGAEKHLIVKKLMGRHYFIVDWQVPENHKPIYA